MPRKNKKFKRHQDMDRFETKRKKFFKKIKKKLKNHEYNEDCNFDI